MKKILATMSALLLMAGCNSEETITPNPVPEGGPETKVLVNNVLVKQRGATRAEGGNTLDVQQRTFAWENDVDIFEHFPEFITPEGCYDDFVFVSNGEPFDLVMLYSNGGYRHTMGIYWYENGELFEQQLWNEVEDENHGYWKNFGGVDSKGEISRKDERAGAYTITLPEGTKYGFYCHSTLNGDEIKEGIHTPLPFGPVVAYNYKFYTEKERNWSYNVAVYDKYLEKGKTDTQAMTTSVAGWTIVGFEDVSITYPSCDRDYNDCVFAMNPVQHIDGVDEPVNEGEVEVDIHQQEHNTWNETKTSVHLRDVTDVTIELPIELADVCPSDDFAIRAYDYATDIKVQGGEMTWQTITVTVEHQTDKVVIKISGLTQALLDAHDGEITVEVHNYFTTDDIWDRLKTSKVKVSNSNVGIKGQIHYKDETSPDKWVKL